MVSRLIPVACIGTALWLQPREPFVWAVCGIAAVAFFLISRIGGPHAD